MAQQERFILLKKGKEENENEKRAKYYVRIKKVNDTTWRKDLYNIYGPLISVTHYSNKDLKVEHGTTYLYEAGTLKESIYYSYGSKIGESKMHDTTQPANSVHYSRPEYPGGIPSWHQFLNKNLRYPMRAVDYEIQGQPGIQFSVTAEGEILDPIIVQSIEYSLDQEALRIILLSKTWTPATKDGKPIQAVHTQHLTFRIEKG